ncbi:MAG: prepilin-type N-terminal cleavage/methylation domain-containing protein [Bacilli bacterium]
MKKLGFTLIELLATIVVLAIIAIITVPIILSVIETSKKSSFQESVKMVIDSVDYYLVSNNLDKLYEDGVEVTDLSLKNGAQLKSGKVMINESGVYVASMIYNGEYCIIGTKQNLQIADECYMLDITSPELSESKIYTTSTSSSIKIIVPKEAITEVESNIKSYTFKLINEELSANEKVTVSENNYIFKSLKNATEYKIKVTLTNENDMKTTKEITVSTTLIYPPTYNIDTTGYATSKTLTITYPERQEGYIYTYTVIMD